jgi:TRAP-type mannitol/chloroaromatic compound transport system permease large subunit
LDPSTWRYSTVEDPSLFLIVLVLVTAGVGVATATSGVGVGVATTGVGVGVLVSGDELHPAIASAEETNAKTNAFLIFLLILASSPIHPPRTARGLIRV